MDETLHARLLSADSFLLPNVSDESFQAVLILINEQNIHPLEAIARELAALSYQIQADYYFDTELFSAVFEINADNLADFIVGFRVPQVLIHSCFDLNTPLFDRNFYPKPKDQYILTARRKVLDLVTRCTFENLAVVGTKVFTHCEEVPYIDNDYYRIGVTAALTTFREFITLDIFDDEDVQDD